MIGTFIVLARTNENKRGLKTVMVTLTQEEIPQLTYDRIDFTERYKIKRKLSQYLDTDVLGFNIISKEVT